MGKYTIEELANAYKPSYDEGLLRGYGLESMAFFMFLEGMKFAETGEVRTIDYDNIK